VIALVALLAVGGARSRKDDQSVARAATDAA